MEKYSGLSLFGHSVNCNRLGIVRRAPGRVNVAKSLPELHRCYLDVYPTDILSLYLPRKCI